MKKNKVGLNWIFGVLDYLNDIYYQKYTSLIFPSHTLVRWLENQLEPTWLKSTVHSMKDIFQFTQILLTNWWIYLIFYNYLLQSHQRKLDKSNVSILKCTIKWKINSSNFYWCSLTTFSISHQWSWTTLDVSQLPTKYKGGCWRNIVDCLKLDINIVGYRPAHLV